MFRRKISKIEYEITKSRESPVGDIHLENMSLVTLPELIGDLSFIRSLHLNDNKISYLDCEKLPPFVENLFISNNSIKSLDLSKAPKSLTTVYANNNNINKIITDGSNIKYLFVDNNNLKEIDNLSGNLKVLHCSKNKISLFKNLGKVERLACSENMLKEFTGTPFLKVLDLSKNPLEKLVNIPKNMELVVLKSTQLQDPLLLDENFLFSKHYSGVPNSIEEYHKAKFATIIQANVRAYLAKKKYKFLRVIRDVNDLSDMKPNTNPKILKVYFRKPDLKIMRRYLTT